MTTTLLVITFVATAASIGYLLHTHFLNRRKRRQQAELWRENVLKELRQIGDSGNTLKVPTQFELSRIDNNGSSIDDHDSYPVVYRGGQTGLPWRSISRNQ